MLVCRRAVLNVIDLFVEITFHSAAHRRIKLGEVADLHVDFVIPSEVEESLTVSGSSRSQITQKYREMLRLRSA
jgi:hypothetical protein